MKIPAPGVQDHRFDVEMMSICLELAREAASQGEVPVGALVVHERQIIARSHNLVEHRRDPTAHAERLVLAEAGQVRRSWRLDGCTIYATLEPCSMCAGAIVLGRLNRLVYGAADSKAGACRSLYRLTQDPRLNHQVEVIPGVLEEACAAILTTFFSQRRCEVHPRRGA